MKTKKEIPFNVQLLESGDKILCHTKGFWQFMSKAIRVITHSYYNHCGDIIIEHKPDIIGLNVPRVSYIDHTRRIKKVFVVEAMPKGVIKTPIEKYLNTKKFMVAVVRFKKTLAKGTNRDIVTKNYRNIIRVNVRRLKANIGKKYDYMAIAWLSIKLPIRALLNLIPFVKRIPQVKGNLLNFRSRFYCAECTCAAAYKLPNARSEHPFAGKKHPKQDCSTITPHDISKSKYLKYLCGTNKK